LLEAMQEHRVTVGRTTYTIEEPYFVLATQNPLEMEGTYPLPEAQLDRFFFKLHVPFPSREELHTIIDRTTTDQTVEVKNVLAREEVLGMQRLARSVPVARHVQDYAIRVLQATHPDGEGATDNVKRFVRTGASPRGAQAMLLAGKIRALLEGRFAPSIDDIKRVAPAALRHRILLNFEGEAEGISPDTVIEQVLAELPAAKA
jgi:MoxR-like ATPase